MECLIGGAFLLLLFVGFLVWLQSALQSKQAQPAPERSRPSEYGGTTRTVRSTPRQQRQTAQVKASDRAITSARKQALKSTPRGTVAYERIRPVSYEGKTVNAICLDAKGNVTGYVDLADMPLEWE